MIKAKKVTSFIGFDLYSGEEIELLRIVGFAEFDSTGTGFEVFYEDSRTKAKWYAKFKKYIMKKNVGKIYR